MCLRIRVKSSVYNRCDVKPSSHAFFIHSAAQSFKVFAKTKWIFCQYFAILKKNCLFKIQERPLFVYKRECLYPLSKFEHINLLGLEKNSKKYQLQWASLFLCFGPSLRFQQTMSAIKLQIWLHIQFYKPIGLCSIEYIS